MSDNELFTWIVRSAGILHFLQLPAMRVASGMLDWPAELAKLRPINRSIVRVIGLAIVLVMTGLGAVVVATADEIAGGGQLAVGLTAFLALFLAFRASVQWLIYAPIWPKDALGRLSNWFLRALFTAQALVYAVACVNAGMSP